MVSQTRHRSEEEIVADILSIVLDGARKTRIMYGANLNYGLAVKYLNKLMDRGLIMHDKEGRMYTLTSMGRRFIEEYAEYKSIEEKLVSHASLLEGKRAVLIQMLEKDELGK